MRKLVCLSMFVVSCLPGLAAAQGNKAFQIARGAFIGANVADVATTISAPCFKNGTCREGNPLYFGARSSSAIAGLKIGYTGANLLFQRYVFKKNKKAGFWVTVAGTVITGTAAAINAKRFH